MHSSAGVGEQSRCCEERTFNLKKAPIDQNSHDAVDHSAEGNLKVFSKFAPIRQTRAELQPKNKEIRGIYANT